MDWFLDASTPLHKIALMVVAIVLFAAVMAFILFAIDRPKRVPSWVVAAGFCGPALLLVTIGLVYPALGTVWNSFRSPDLSRSVGFENYTTIFTNDGLQQVLGNTVLWVVLVPLISTAFGLVYAYIVDRTRFENVAKLLIFLPLSISGVAAGLIWKFVYDYKADQAGTEQIGLLNQIMVWLGLAPQQWILNQPWNSFFLIVVMIWINAGFAMTVLSASIKAIPDDMVEAARLDGVSAWEMFRFVTVPAIRPALVVVLTTVAISTLKVFDVVFVMTGGNFGTSVVANEFYRQSFVQANQGLGAALAVLLFVLVVPIIIYNVRQMRLAEDVR